MKLEVANGICVLLISEVKMKLLVTQSCLTLCHPMDCSRMGSSVMEFSRQEYWMGSHFLLQGIFLTQGLNLGFLHCRQILYPLSHQGSLSINDSIIQFSSVAQSCLTLCDPMNRSTPGLPVHHQLLESTQTYVHWVSDTIQPSHPLSSPSPPALNLSQHQGLFQWVSSSHQVAKVLEFQPQHQSFQRTPRTDLAVQGTLKSLLQHTVQKHQFFGTQLSL